jgi:hypothetical protein
MASLTRVLNAWPATLSHVFASGETPIDPTGTPTCVITDANGDAVESPTASVVGDDSGRVTATMSPRPELALLTVTWTATVSGTSITEVDYVEIVGGYFFILSEGRAADASLADVAKYPEADLLAARMDVEVECERICDRAFVPRYRREVLHGTGTTDLILSYGDVRTIRRASIASRTGGTFVDLSTTQLAALASTDDRVLRRTDGNAWTEGLENIVVEYEYGWDAPPSDLVFAAKTRLRSRLNLNRSGIPDRASSYTVEDGGTYRLSMPGAYQTGIPDVDAAYERWSARARTGTGGTGAAVPASRTLQFQPQRYSLFHGSVT